MNEDGSNEARWSARTISAVDASVPRHHSNQQDLAAVANDEDRITKTKGLRALQGSAARQQRWLVRNNICIIPAGTRACVQLVTDSEGEYGTLRAQYPYVLGGAGGDEP